MTDALAQKILIATELSEPSLKAVRMGAELARAMGAEIVLASAFDPTPFVPVVGFAADMANWKQLMDEQETAIRKRLERLGTEELEGLACTIEVIRDGAAARAIAELARKTEADLVVVGSHGRTGVGRALLGSVAEKVARSAPCPVLVAR